MGKRIQAFATGAIWSCMVGVCLWKLRAGSTNVGRFTSDTAIPILMANDRHWDLFQCFFYGQDRYGAWPFLLIRIAWSAADAVVRWEHVQLALVAWVLIGSVPLAQLLPSGRALAALLYLLPATMSPEPRSLFDVAPPYGWQLTALVLAWWRLRALLEAEATTAPSTRLLPRTLPWLAALLFSVLATWMSPVSGPILLGLGLLEAWRMRLTSLNVPRFLIAVKSVLPAIVAAAFELALRSAYHAFAQRHFGQDYHTTLRVEWANLEPNAKIVFQRLVDFHWNFLLALGAVGALAMLGLILRWGSRLRDSADVAGNRATIDGAFLTLGTAWIALIQVPILIAAVQVRINDFDLRYFALVFFFGSLAALAAFTTAATMIAGRKQRFGRWSSAAAAIGMAAIAFLLPRPVEDLEYAHQKRLASELALRAPGAVLLSDYWDTYQLAALEPRALLPVPFDGNWLRTPWYIEALRSAREVIVGHQGRGPDAPPEPVLTQYGTKLYLVVHHWYAGYGRRYSLYTAIAPVAGSGNR